MNEIKSMLGANLRRRTKDGFALGYNIIFPLVMVGILGMLTKGSFKQEITSFQYYALVMIPFSICMGIITIAYAGKDDAYAKTAIRVMISPVKLYTIVVSKVMAGTIVLTGCAWLVYGFSILVWKVPVTGALGVLVLYLSIAFAISCVGTFVGLAMKDFFKVKNLLTLPIGIFALLAGVFFRVGSLNQVEQTLFLLSPLTWINRSTFLLLYDGTGVECGIVCILLVGIGVCFLAASIKGFKKEEYSYGSLPGYEK